MEFVLIIVLTFFASAIGASTGFGLSTIMIPVLSFFLPFSVTLLFVGIVHWFLDIWKMIFFKKGFDLKLVLMFGIPGIVVSFLAAKLPLSLDESMLARGLGLFLILYVAYLLFKPGWRVRPSVFSAIIGGSLSGFFAGIFGVGGAIRSTFLTAFDLKKNVFLFTSGVIGFLIDSSRISQYLFSGIKINGNLSTVLALCIPASLLGAYFAKRMVDKIPQKSFRLFIAIALFVIGLKFLVLP